MCRVWMEFGFQMGKAEDETYMNGKEKKKSNSKGPSI